MTLIARTLLLCLASASLSTAQRPSSSDWGSNWWNPNNPDNDNGDGNNFYNGYGPGSSRTDAFFDTQRTALLAHGILASLAFVVLFPSGAILIRLASFRHAWLIHGLFQLIAYIVFTAAFGLGVYIATNIPVANFTSRYHPLIGILVFVLLAFQPVLGVVHHLKFKKVGRRTFWSYAHLWLGRVAITLGIINGGLGMLLAFEAPAFVNVRPSKGQIVAYGVVAGIMWVLWVVAAIVGERRRMRAPSRGEASERKEIEDGSPPAYSRKGGYA